MKFIIVALFIALNTAVASKDPKDISGCKGTAVKSAIDYAKAYWHTYIRYVNGKVLSVTGTGANMLSQYDISLEQCGNGDCGSLSFSVKVQGKAPDCVAEPVILTGEE